MHTQISSMRQLAILTLLAPIVAARSKLGVMWDPYETIPGPLTPEEQPAWYKNLTNWRASIPYAGGVFNVSQIAWTITSYIQPQMHPFDLFFFNQVDGFTVDKYIDDVVARYGGIDSVLVWPTYPMLGVDDRNQYDMFRALPGGLAGVANWTAQLHARGVRVLWPYNPWDVGTRREGVSDQQALAELLAQVCRWDVCLVPPPHSPTPHPSLSPCCSADERGWLQWRHDGLH
jgi:hypothetical protein